MKRISLAKGGLLGGLTGLTFIALTYLGDQIAGLTFLPFDLFDWMTRRLPGPLVTRVIDTMVSAINAINLGPTSQVAKSVEQGIALLQIVGTGVILGVVLAALGRKYPDRLVQLGALGGLALLIPAIVVEISMGFPPAGPVITILWLALVTIGWGAVLGRLIRDTAPEPPPESESGMSRRQFLWLVGAGSFAVVVGALGLEVIPKGGQQAQGGGVPKEMVGANDTSGPAASPPQSELENRIEPAPGTRTELTSNENFYRIDINTRPPEVSADEWRLELKGLVNNPMTLTLEDIRSRPAQSQVITLSCISNEIGGDLISTGLWTGTRVKDLLEEAGLRAGAREVAMKSVDGFYESMPLEEAMDERTLLVYEMNSEPLPVKHGFPLRIFIPGHYGMKQPKWLESMEVIDHQGAGYWVDRGWSEEAVPQTTSVIDNAAVDSAQDHTIPVGGIAYAGERGISKVEVQVDDGPWEATQLRTPPLSPLTWVQWRYSWNANPGRHTLRVRAYDGEGNLQPTQESPPHPNGATGIDSYGVTVRS
jgi:DMSO/TMAO reductase YedYZ molybdopterin-dependent catalytic subunit